MIYSEEFTARIKAEKQERQIKNFQRAIAFKKLRMRFIEIIFQIRVHQPIDAFKPRLISPSLYGVRVSGVPFFTSH
jgi:hypothetical protein